MDIALQPVIGDSIAYAKNEILDAVKKNAFPEKKNWYAITTSYEDNTLLYVISGAEFQHPYYHRKHCPLKLIGIAGSKNEAFELIRNMVQDRVDSDSLMEMKTYLKDI